MFLERQPRGVLEVAAEHVDDLVDGANVDVTRVLVLVVHQPHDLGTCAVAGWEWRGEGHYSKK